MDKVRKVAVAFVFCLFIGAINGQCKQFTQIGEWGFGAGGTTYIGEFNRNFNFKFIRPAGFAFYRANLVEESLILKIDVLIGSLSGDQSKLNDPFIQSRGYTFNATFFEFSPQLEYNFFDFRSVKELKYRRFHTPYLFAGPFMTSYLNASNTAPQRDFKNIYIGFVFGAGIKFKVSHNWNLGAQLGARMPYSDRLDGLLNDTMGNYPKNDDIYFVAGIYASYSIFANLCKNDPY